MERICKNESDFQNHARNDILKAANPQADTSGADEAKCKDHISLVVIEKACDQESLRGCLASWLSFCWHWITAAYHHVQRGHCQLSRTHGNP